MKPVEQQRARDEPRKACGPWIAFRVTVLLVLVVVAWRISLMLFGSHGPLGLVDGRLRPCPSSPNCVCSQDEDAGHHIEPLQFTGSPREAWDRLHTLVETLPRTRVVSRDDRYLHVEFTTPLLRFIDDIEFLLDETNSVIHVRSASRIGHSDLGTNRKRIEAIRQRSYLCGAST